MRLIARVSGVESGVETCLTVDKSSNHVVLREPSSQITSSSQRQRATMTGPKHFMFDQVFGPDDSLVCMTLTNLIISQLPTLFIGTPRICNFILCGCVFLARGYRP